MTCETKIRLILIHCKFTLIFLNINHTTRKTSPKNYRLNLPKIRLNFQKIQSLTSNFSLCNRLNIKTH